MFTLIIRMETKCDVSDVHRGGIVGGRLVWMFTQNGAYIDLQWVRKVFRPL